LISNIFYCSIKRSTEFHHVRNSSNKNYSFLGFLSAQQHHVKYHQEQNWVCDEILQLLRHQRSHFNFSNKTQLKIKIKIEFIFNWVRSSSMHLDLDQTRSDQNSGEWLHCSREQWSWTPLFNSLSIVHLSEQWRVKFHCSSESGEWNSPLNKNTAGKNTWMLDEKHEKITSPETEVKPHF
jgi:hypothetical protein